MSKHYTRALLAGALLVTAGATAAGASVSSSSLPEPASTDVVGATLIEANEDGTATVCALEGEAAEMVLTPSTGVEPSAGPAIGVGTITPALPAPEGAQAAPEVVPTAPIGDMILGSTDDGHVIAEWSADQVRAGTPEECAALMEDAGR